MHRIYFLPCLREKGVHYIAPTLPGWGYSSPRPSVTTTGSITSDLTELINYLHPDEPNLRLYIAGGSYGTVPAQMLYGAPFDVFPLGRHIVDCILLAPFSPFRYHKDFARFYDVENYLAVGIRSPWQVISRLIATIIATKMRSVETAAPLIRDAMFGHMDDIERIALAKWTEETGRTQGDFESEMTANAVKSVSRTWAGFGEVSAVLHSNWHFIPNQLDQELCRRPMLIVPSTQDELGPEMADWLRQNYKNSKVHWVDGGHVASLYSANAIWRQFIEQVDSSDSHPSIVAAVTLS